MENQTLRPHHGVPSVGDVIPTFISPYDLKLNTETYLKCLEVLVQALIGGVSSNTTLRHPTWAGEPIVSWEKVSVTNSTVISGHLTSQFEVPLVIMYWTQLCKNRQSPHNTKDKMKAMITAAFTTLNKRVIGKACRRIRSYLGTIVKNNDNFFE